MREILNDPELDSYVLELVEEVPDDVEKYEEGLREIAAGLEDRRLRAQAALARRVYAESDVHDHQELARRLRERHKAQ